MKSIYLILGIILGVLLVTGLGAIVHVLTGSALAGGLTSFAGGLMVGKAAARAAMGDY